MQLIILASGRGKRLGKIKNYSSKLFLKLNENITIFDYFKNFFSKFKDVIIILGYKFYINKRKILNKQNKTIIVRNKNYYKTNMVESLFLAKKKINSNVIIIYSDVIFSLNIIDKLLKTQGSLLPLNKDWLKVWKKRMNKRKILEDAENVEVKKNLIYSIGGKIGKKIPKGQFMGILKLSNGDFQKLHKYYNKIKNKNIQLTQFLNLAIKDKILKIKYRYFSNLWMEIDNKKDYLLAKKIFYKINNDI